MNLLITGIVIADPNSQFNQKKCDVRVEQGKITAIGNNLTASKNEQVFDGRVLFSLQVSLI
ncbi:hypothetical protein [Pedobacter panaciterrae]